MPCIWISSGTWISVGIIIKYYVILKCNITIFLFEIHNSINKLIVVQIEHDISFTLFSRSVFLWLKIKSFMETWHLLRSALFIGRILLIELIFAKCNWKSINLSNNTRAGVNCTHNCLRAPTKPITWFECFIY